MSRFPTCAHTGLPRVMCGHCNGSHGVEADFHPRRREEDEPRLVKMRGKVEWRGIGRSTEQPTTPCATRADVHKALNAVPLTCTHCKGLGFIRPDRRHVEVSKTPLESLTSNVRVSQWPESNAPYEPDYTCAWCGGTGTFKPLWDGIKTPDATPTAREHTVTANGSCVKPSGFSTWAHTNMLRTLSRR